MQKKVADSLAYSKKRPTFATAIEREIASKQRKGAVVQPG